jgi:hypothetical protein
MNCVSKPRIGICVFPESAPKLIACPIDLDAHLLKKISYCMWELAGERLVALPDIPKLLFIVLC